MQFTVDEQSAKARLDRYVSERLPEQSRNQIQKWIKSGAILVNGKEATVHKFLKTGDEVTVTIPEEKPAPEAPELEILAQGKGWVAVNKPAGVLSHHAQGSLHSPAVTDWLVKEFPEAALVGDEDRPGTVHRLDRDTSGILLLATSPDFYTHIKQQFHDRAVEKTYLALVHGNLPEPTGVIEKPIGRSKSEQRMAARTKSIDGKDREAITEYKVLKSFQGFDEIEAKPRTGRTHQIRVHMMSLGHPVVGDYKYRIRRIKPVELGRLFLHANKLKFADLDGEQISIEAPLPEGLQDYLSTLRS